MSVSGKLESLIESAGPFWAGEAEVFRTYWNWEGRTRETDRRWLAFQCYKEFWGLSLSPLDKGILLASAQELVTAFPKIDTEIDRHEVLDIAEGLYTEFRHYCAFADAYDALSLPGELKIDPALTKAVAFPEDLVLVELRLRHKREYPRVGPRAFRFTEGGYCTLFSEGMKLRTQTDGPHGRANALIAAACAQVYEDEFGHMLKGIVGLDEEGWSEEEWRTMELLSIEQLKGRIVMRNAQFGHPLSDRRLAEIFAGRCTPIAFDYDKAHLSA